MALGQQRARARASVAPRARRAARRAADGAASGAAAWPSGVRRSDRRLGRRRALRRASAAASAPRRARRAGGASNHSSVRGSPPQARTSSTVAGEIDARDLRLAMRPQPIARVPQPHGDARPPSGRRGRRADRPSPVRCARSRGCRSRGPRRSARPCAGRCRRRRSRPGTVSVVSAMLVARITRGRRSARARRPARRRPGRRAAAGPATPARRQRREPSAARRISGAPGRKQSTRPASRASASRSRRVRGDARPVADLERVTAGPARRRPDSRRETRRRGPASIVADITTSRRSSRASHAWRASARPRSAWMLRSWNSSMTIVRKPLSERILLQPRGQDAFGGDEQPRVAREAPIEPDVPADFAAERPALLVGDAPRDRARGHAPRLQQQHRPVGVSAGGTRVVFPAPGAAVTTTRPPRRTSATIWSRWSSMGSFILGTASTSHSAIGSSAADRHSVFGAPCTPQPRTSHSGSRNAIVFRRVVA